MQKSSNDTSNIPTSMNATINGATFSGSLAIFAINSGTLEIDGGNQNLQNNLALQLLDPYIRLYVNNYTAGTTGTFSFTTGTSIASSSIDSNSAMGTYVTGCSGSVVITSATSTVISGTFNFKCFDSTSVDNGTFTARLN